jgi:hypothetical protein
LFTDYKKLLKKGSKIDCPDQNSRTPLFYAAEAENLEVVDLLIKEKADLGIKDRFENTSLLYFYYSGQNFFKDLRNSIHTLLTVDFFVSNGRI